MKKPVSQSEEIFQKTLIMSPDAVNINRMSDGLYVSVNEGFTKITGYTKEDVLGKTSAEINIWADPKDRDMLVKKLKSDCKIANLEMKFRMKNGTIRSGLMSAAYIELNGVPHILSITKDITDTKEIEIELNKSEARYRELMELAPDGIMLGSDKGIITRANSRMLKITGRTPDELIGSDITILFSPEELKKSPLRYDLVNAGELVTIERNIQRPDGTSIPVEMHTKMMPDGSYQMFCQDISERRKSEYELRKLSRAVEQSPVSIVITDPSGNIEYVNPKLCETTGYTKAELIGQNPRIWSSHEKSEEEYREFWNTINAGNEWKGEFHNRKKNGELFWERVSVSAIRNEQNEITHFIGIKEDITLRKILEEKTRASEKRYRELFLSNPIPAFIFYEDTLEFIEVNDSAVVNYGYSREEFSSMTLKDIRHPEEIPEFLKTLKLFRPDTFHSDLAHHIRKDGSIFPADVTSYSLPEKNGRRPRLLMAIDISERVRAAEQMKFAKEKAEASDRLKTTFLNNISHEVRTPLNGILGFIDIITQPELSARDRKDSVLMLMESSNRLINTITNYMDISLLTSGNMSVTNNIFIPASIMREIFNNYERICSERNLKLILEIPERYENLSVNSDKEIFQKAVTHLLDNAVKFTERGEIHIGLTDTRDKVEFYVRDDGIGISKDSLDNIFDPFYKGEHLLTRQSEGSGLGLTIAKGMLELIGGTIHVETHEGKGSVFKFTIPSWTPSPEISSSTKNIKTNVKNPLILVAEDDETNFFYLSALLKFETDADVIHASNGQEAIDMFKENPDISMILMDIKMPEIDGLEATRQIKQIRKDIPIIAITAYSMSGDKERVLAAGCDGYISKPINKVNLFNKMEEFLDLRPA
jgi:PAS domain S-box-containing protein